MWKKMSVIIISLVATFSVIYGVNENINAAKVIPDTFLMGGITWRVLTEDIPNDEYTIVPTEKLVPKYCSSMTSGFSGADKFYVETVNTTACMRLINDAYKGNATKNDAIGELIRIIPQNTEIISKLEFVGLDKYNELTNNGTKLDTIKSISNFLWLIDGLPGTGATAFVQTGLYKVEVGTTLWAEIYPIIKVKIYDQLYDLTFTPFYQTGASRANIHEYGSNVKSGMKVGAISSRYGADPIKYTIIEDPAHLGDASKFILNGKDILVGSNDLDAGDYNFKIQAQDKYGNPETPLEISVTINVEKAPPTISFDNANQSEIKIGDASYSHTITTSNSDTLSPSDITYSLSGGVTGVLTVATDITNPLQYDLNVVSTHSGTGLPATYNLEASIKETENYKAVKTSTNKKIYVYKELNALTWSPSKNNFSTTDVKSGAVVGNLVAVDGVGPFTYELVKTTDGLYDASVGKDNASFLVGNAATAAGTKVDVKTSSDLVAGTYNLQFKVTDAKSKEVIATATIQVDAKSQSALEFKDKVGGSIITGSGQKVKFNDTSAKLIAEGGDTSNDIVYAYAPSSMQPSGVDPSGYAVINASNGLIAPTRTGTIKVQAVRPGDGTYGDAKVYMDLTIEAAEQVIAFNNKESVVNIEIGKDLLLDAKGNIKTTNEAGIGSITYKSSDETIATVDKDTGKVTGIKEGTVTITATLNDSKETGYNSNYDTVSATKSVKIYKGMSLTWTASSPNIKAEDNAVDDKAGTISVSDNLGAVDFAISTNSTTENADASFFKVVSNGTSADLKLLQTISASDWLSHTGTFKVQVEAKDKNGTQTIDIVVNVDEAENDAYFTENGSKITTLKKKYGENGNSFSLTSYSSNGGSVTYDVDSSDASQTFTVSGTGDVSIKKVGSGIASAVISSGSGYAGVTITLPITIEAGDQVIAFKDTTTLNRQFTLNETFSDPAELKETSKDSLSTRTITYNSLSPTICSVDSVGTITMKAKGTCEITAKNDDSNWTIASVTKKINLYDGMGVSFAQNGSLQAETVSTGASSKAGDLSVSGGMDPKTFAISTSNDPKNKDASLFQVNSTGVVSFKKAIMATDLVGKYNTTKKLYELYVQIDTTDSANTIVTTDAIVEVKGAPLKAEFDTDGTGKNKEEFGPGKTFTLSLSSNKGKGVPSYRLKNDPTMPNDVLESVDASGLVTIQHANDPSFVGNPLMVEAVIPASNGYDEETIEVEVEITKAPQPDFAFKTPNIKLGHGASITPFFNGNISNGTITMTSGNNALATISGSDIKAKTIDGSVVVTAINSGNRDYKSATATANVTISSAPAYDFVISVPAATYGDTGLKADIVLNGASGANQAQTWSSSDEAIAAIDADKNITIKKAGTVTITCRQASTGEPSVTATAVMVIDPKPITVTIDDASKYVGEAVPAFNAVIPTDDLVGSDTLGQPTFSCKDGTALVKPDTKAGTYDINGTYPTASYPNYAITVKKGKLTIKQDASLAEWSHLEGATSKTTLDGTKWVNEDVNVVLDSAVESAGTYDEISLDNTLWGTTQTINKEGNTTSNVYFRINASKIIATSQSTSVKIDKTKPVVKSITGTPANRNALSELLNSLTFGTYFKPKYEVSIIAEDVLPKDVKENSKLKSIQYNVYQLKDDSTLSDAIASGEMKSGDTLKLVDEGNYMVCATALDNAGNQSAELCSGIRIQSIGDDSDEDGIPDLNIDTDGDGNPDINITKNKGDKLPWLNIDTDGDGIADMNIDTNKDGIPDLNTGIITAWKPNKEVDLDENGTPDYKTDTTLKGMNNIDSDKDGYPDINIDRDLNGTPELNIDTDQDFTKPEIDIDGDGDGIKDINIDENNDGTPDKNIVLISTWKPDVDVKEDGKIVFDTMKITYTPKDQLEDNGIVIKPSNPGQVFLPNYALKVDDITKNVDEKAKNEIIEITGSKSEIKHVYDVSLSDGDKTIQPDGSIVVRIPVDETIKNPRILLQNKAGNFEEVEVTIENGYFVFETDYLGQVSIVGDKEEGIDQTQPTPNPDGDKTPNTGNSDPSNTNPNTSVKGTYTSGTGGALTGDSTNITIAISFLLGSGFIVCKMLNARRKKDTV